MPSTDHGAISQTLLHRGLTEGIDERGLLHSHSKSKHILLNAAYIYEIHLWSEVQHLASHSVQSDAPMKPQKLDMKVTIASPNGWPLGTDIQSQEGSISVPPGDLSL